MLADQLETKMSMGGVQVEATAIELLDRFFQFTTGRLAAAPCFPVNRRFGHRRAHAHLPRATPGSRFPRTPTHNATNLAGGGL